MEKEKKKITGGPKTREIVVHALSKIDRRSMRGKKRIGDGDVIAPKKKVRSKGMIFCGGRIIL